MGDSPAELVVFEQKLITLEDKLGVHMEAYEARCLRTDVQLSQLATAQQVNTDAIGLLVKETVDIVRLHRDLESVTRVGKSVQSFGIWILKWPLIGTGAYAAFSWVVSHLPTN